MLRKKEEAIKLLEKVPDADVDRIFLEMLCVFMNKMGALIKQKLRLQAKLYELAESHELTSEAVVQCSRELDKVIVQLQRAECSC